MFKKIPFPHSIFKEAALTIGPPYSPQRRFFTFFHLIWGTMTTASGMVFLILKDQGYSQFIAILLAAITGLMGFLLGAILAPITIRVIQAAVTIGIVCNPIIKPQEKDRIT